MTADLKTQIRDFAAEFAADLPPVEADSIVSGRGTYRVISPGSIPNHWSTVQHRRHQVSGWLVAASAALVVLIAVGGVSWLLRGAIPDVADEPATPTTDAIVTPDTAVSESPVLPDLGLEDVPVFEATVRYTFDDRDGRAYEGATVDVRISYDPPDSFRRDIVAFEPEEMEVRFGKIGNYVATDGTFPIFTGETTEEGEELGPLVWFNWDGACTHVPEAVATEVVGSVTLTIIECGSADSQWVAAGTPWRIKVDAATGIVFDVEAELSEGEFKIPGQSIEILSIDYAPEFATGHFATPIPEPPAIAGEPFAFTYTVDDGREVAVSWLNHNTWRSDFIVGGGSGVGSGSYTIYRDGTLYTYNTNTNRHSEERVFAWEGRGLLVEWMCDSSGVCQYAHSTDEGSELTCEVSQGGRIAGRLVSRYDCEATIWFPVQTLWVDNELGYILRSTEASLQVLSIDLSPSFAPALFDQQCPTIDCTPAPTE